MQKLGLVVLFVGVLLVIVGFWLFSPVALDDYEGALLMSFGRISGLF